MSEEANIISINLKKINCDDILTLQVPSDIDIDALKVLAADETGIPADSMRLIFCGKSLKSQTKLSDYKVADGQTIHVFPGPQHKLGTPEPEQPQAPPPPQNPPQVEVHIQNIVSDNTNSRNFQDPLIRIQEILAKLQSTVSELQLSDLEDNADQKKQLAQRLYQEVVEAEGSLMMNATVINSEFEDDEPQIPQPGGARRRVITGGFPGGMMTSIAGDLQSILRDLGIPGMSGNMGQPAQPAPQQQQQQAPPAPDNQ